MRLVWPLLGLVALAVGCVTAEPEAGPTAKPAPTAAPPASDPVEVLNATYDFSRNPEGQRNEVTLEFPEDARTFDLAVSWSSLGPTATTRGVRVSLFDVDGDRVGDCSLDTNVVTQVEGRGCGPQTNNVREGAYHLVWEGTGTVQAHVTIVAR